ncbi:zinc ABC transporter substrate-binding protein [Candidatus Woesearchaeota archaeon]|nr:zinc ABC transporter substrate-binding protein [Candidatus Woesearchaeota archaeon]
MKRINSVNLNLKMITPKMMRSRIVLLCIIVFVLFLVGCTSSPSKIPPSDSTPQKLTVATTFFPLFSLTREIVGNRAEVYSLVPPGIEPHDYEATAGDLQAMARASVFVTMGVEFAPFEDTLVSSLAPNVRIIPAGAGIQQLVSDDPDSSNGLDPHIWLSPQNAKTMVQNIVNGLLMVEPQQGLEYLANAKQALAQLDQLDSEFKEGLAHCSKNVVLVNHNAFSYLARDYGFTTISINGLEPEAEPTPLQVKGLIDQARAHDIHFVLYESLVDPRVATTIASGVGAKVLKLDPLEGTDDPAATYFTLMRENLNTLRTALECQ